MGPPLPCNKIKLVDVPDMQYYAKDGKGEVRQRHMKVTVSKTWLLRFNSLSTDVVGLLLSNTGIAQHEMRYCLKSAEYENLNYFRVF